MPWFIHADNKGAALIKEPAPKALNRTASDCLTGLKPAKEEA
jgi:hypothetical protein